MKKITNMTNNEAKSFFLESNSYCNIDLPIYFNFQPLIDNISLTKIISEKEVDKIHSDY